jgi:4'-phosphopantetheinyl transferase
MESTRLDTPKGIEARLGWAPGSEPRERIRTLAKQMLAERLEIDAAFVNIDREVPKQFGHHPQLVAVVDGRDVPVAIRTASYRTASVVALSESGLLVGLDIRDHQADDVSLREIREHSHLWGDSLWEKASNEQLVLHWSRVQAVRQADPRGVSIRPEQVRLDPPFAKAWTPERRAEYRLADLSRGGFLITMAYGTPATD